MRTDLVEVHPRRLLAIVTIGVLGLAGATWLSAPASPAPSQFIRCEHDHGLGQLNAEIADVNARLAVLQGERERAEARRELGRLERRLDTLANSLEGSTDEAAVDFSDVLQEGATRDGHPLRR